VVDEDIRLQGLSKAQWGCLERESAPLSDRHARSRVREGRSRQMPLQIAAGRWEVSA